VMKAKPMLVVGSPHALLPISTLTLKTQKLMRCSSSSRR